MDRNVGRSKDRNMDRSRDRNMERSMDRNIDSSRNRNIDRSSDRNMDRSRDRNMENSRDIAMERAVEKNRENMDRMDRNKDMDQIQKLHCMDTDRRDGTPIVRSRSNSIHRVQSESDGRCKEEVRIITYLRQLNTFLPFHIYMFNVLLTHFIGVSQQV